MFGIYNVLFFLVNGSLGVVFCSYSANVLAIVVRVARITFVVKACPSNETTFVVSTECVFVSKVGSLGDGPRHCNTKVYAPRVYRTLVLRRAIAQVLSVVS